MKFFAEVSSLAVISSLCSRVPRMRKTGPDPKVVQAARKEGEIVWYTTMSSDQSNAFMARFQQKYPFLKPPIVPFRRKRVAQSNYHRGEGREKFFRRRRTARARSFCRSWNMGLLAPYVSPERKMIPDDLKDKKGLLDIGLRQLGGARATTPILTNGTAGAAHLQRSFTTAMERTKNFRRRYVTRPFCKD